MEEWHGIRGHEAAGYLLASTNGKERSAQKGRELSARNDTQEENARCDAM